MKIYSDLSNADYHSMSEHVSSSFVKAVAKHSIQRAMKKFDPTPALIFGDAMHTYFEDRLAFVRRFVVFDDAEIVDQIIKRRPEISVPSMTKEYKSFKSEFEQSLNEGQTVITQHEMDSIEYMYRSAVDNTGLQSIYQDHAHDDIWDEYSFLTEEPDHHGLLYRVRPDRLLVKNDEPQVIIDWKSCRDASEKAFRLDFWKFRYDLQAAFYCSLLEVPMDQFFYVAIEKEFPYNSAVFSIDEDTQMRAMRELELIKERIGEWKENPSPETSGLANANKITYL
jgi:hypothetical protein